MSHAQSAPHETVHRRTIKGEMATINECVWLSATASQMLRLVNGFTPTAYLVVLMVIAPDKAALALAELERHGLIEQTNAELVLNHEAWALAAG